MDRGKHLTEHQLLELIEERSDFEDDGEDDDRLEIYCSVPKERICPDDIIEESDDEDDELYYNEAASSTEPNKRYHPREKFIRTVLRSSAKKSGAGPSNTTGPETIPALSLSTENELQYTSKNKIQWRHMRTNDTSSTIEFVRNERTPKAVKTPYQYFSAYLPPQFFEDVAHYTNVYSVQQGTNFNMCTPSEIQTCFALHGIMGVLKFPRISMFWQKGLALPIFTENMNRNRFYAIRNHLHLVDNNAKPADCADKFYKVRPIMEKVRQRLLQLKLEENLCIDEQIIPFKGQLAVKQYIKGKPCPWGIKVFVICGQSGMPYDFVAYQGSSTEINEITFKNLGFSAAIVLKLAERIPRDVFGHKLYFDNFFTSYQLLEILECRKIFAAGTVRINRFKNPPLPSDTEMKKKGRGTSEQVISRDGKIIITKWYDNKAVYLASNFVGIGKTDEAKRYDKKTHNYIDIPRPEVVQLYNSGMGGVDLLDQMIQYYRIFIRSKKWTLRVIMQFFDMAVTASWMEYKADCSENGILERDKMDLMAFKMDLCTTLVSIHKSAKKRTGRPSTSSIALEEAGAPTNKKLFLPPSNDVRLDQVGHLPVFVEAANAGRCKYPVCKQKTFIMCEKCKAFLCIKRGINCFNKYHTK